MKSYFTLRLIPVYIIVGIFLLHCQSSLAGIIYVNITAAGTHDGTSWTNAFLDLQTAIDAAVSNDEIWVAEGTYFPTEPHGDITDRDRTFYINKSIKIYGGFDATAGSEGQFELRDVKANPTILNGDLGELSLSDDNAFHVLWLDHVGSEMVLDGFTVTNGVGSYGAGINNDGSATGSSSPTIANCIFDKNVTTEAGGAILNNGSEGEANPIFINCKFTSNTASGGGAVANLANPGGDASPVFMNCQFKGNSGPTAGGGAIENIALSDGSASPHLVNCLFSGNFSSSGAMHSFANDTGSLTPVIVNCTFAGNAGGSVTTSAIGGSVATPVIKNSIFWGNSGGGGIFDNGSTTTVTYSLVPFGVFPGEGNLSLNPDFVNVPDFNTAPTLEGDLHLTSGSIAINAGDNDSVEPNDTTDLDGLPRIFIPNGGVGVVDMGAYEFQGGSVGVSNIELLEHWDISPNPASDDVTITIEPSTSQGFIRLLDIKGRVLIQGLLESNISSYNFSVENLTSGVYPVQVVINGKVSTRQLIIE